MKTKAMRGIDVPVARMIASQVESYVLFKRGLGIEMATDASTLAQLVRYADALGHAGPIDLDIALGWATSGRGHSRAYEAKRYEMARRVADFSRATDPSLPCLPRGLLKKTKERVTPYIYTDEEVSLLMSCASRLYSQQDPLRPLALEFSIGLMRSCGLRTCEVAALEDSDFDGGSGMLTVRLSKNGRSRLIPLSGSVSAAVEAYRGRRDSLRGGSQCTRLVLGSGGGEVRIWTLEAMFSELRMCLLGRGEMWTRRPPRLYDLRHTMAVRTLLRWHGEGRDVNAMLPVLARYLGHASISETYWYLTGAPELMELACSAFESHLMGAAL